MIMHKKYSTIAIVISFILGSIFGIKYTQNKISNLTQTQTQNSDPNMVTIPRSTMDFYEQIAGEEKGKIIKTTKSIFDPKSMHFSSPLLIGKNVDITEYSYKGDKIVSKVINLSDTNRVSVWEHRTAKGTTYLDSHFVTFDGYENYSLFPRFVIPRVSGWVEEYLPLSQRSESSQQQKFYVEAELAPKSIGVVELSTYLKYFQNVKYTDVYPTLLSISDSALDVSSSSDPEYIAALDRIKKIADSITIGNE